MIAFPSLEGFGPTRATLHRYAQAVGAIAHAHATAHPKWWHVSLRVTPNGLASSSIALPDGGSLDMRLNLKTHTLEMDAGPQGMKSFDMTKGWTGTQMGNALIDYAAELGLEGDYERARFESDDTGTYDTEMVGRFLLALDSADRVFSKHQAGLKGKTGPVQLWPHGFDLSTEWFGTRVESYEENGETEMLPSQINLGFYPGDGDEDTYFYSNPWPFEEQLLENPLPAGANWHTESWKGSMLPYLAIREHVDAEDRLLDYAQAVYDIASPTLTAAG